MGFFSSIGKSLGFGGSSNIGRRAAEQRQIFNREAITRGDTDFGITEGKIGTQQDQLREDFLSQRDQTEAGFDPFIQGGEQGLEFLRDTATAGGFNDFLSQIMSGDLFQSFKDQQVSDAEGFFAASGQGGSGGALKELANISPQLALQLFGNLQGSNKDLANFGFQGVDRRAGLGNQLTLGQGGLSTGLVDIESRLRDSVSGRAQGLISDIGTGKSSGILADEGINTQRFNNLINLVGTLGSFGSGGAGGSGGGGTPFTATPETLQGTQLPSLRNAQGNFF
jgi:hypothetical protein